MSQLSPEGKATNTLLIVIPKMMMGFPLARPVGRSSTLNNEDEVQNSIYNKLNMKYKYIS